MRFEGLSLPSSFLLPPPSSYSILILTYVHIILIGIIENVVKLWLKEAG
jgi:hypothetical protein